MIDNIVAIDPMESVTITELNFVKHYGKAGEDLLDRVRDTEREKVLSDVRDFIFKYQIAKEVVIDGQRFLVVDGEKKEFGYPYPDTKEKYAIYYLLAKLNQLKGSDEK